MRWNWPWIFTVPLIQQSILLQFSCISTVLISWAVWRVELWVYPTALQLRTLIMINAKTTQKFLPLTECQCSACVAFLWRAVPLTFRALVAVGLTEFSFSPISPKVPLWSNPSYSVQSQMTMTIGIDSLSRSLSSSLFTRPNVLKLKLTLSMQKGKGLLSSSQKKCLWWALNGVVLSAW